MLLYLSLDQLRSFPEVVVHVSWLKCGELERVNACVGFKGPWQPPVGVNIFYPIAVRCTANWENVELFCAGAKGESARGACMTEEKGGCKARSECGVNERVDEWWMVVLPRRGVVFECDKESFGVGD